MKKYIVIQYNSILYARISRKRLSAIQVCVFTDKWNNIIVQAFTKQEKRKTEEELQGKTAPARGANIRKSVWIEHREIAREIFGRLDFGRFSNNFELIFMYF